MPSELPIDSAASKKRQHPVFAIAAWATLLAVVIAAAQLGFDVWSRSKVDKRLVGTWELSIPADPTDPSHPTKYLWTQSIEEDGDYLFTATGPPAPFSWSADFAAGDGNWTLRGDFDDRGTYEVISDKKFSMPGRLGPAVWTRKK